MKGFPDASEIVAETIAATGGKAEGTEPSALPDSDLQQQPQHRSAMENQQGNSQTARPLPTAEELRWDKSHDLAEVLLVHLGVETREEIDHRRKRSGKASGRSALRTVKQVTAEIRRTVVAMAAGEITAVDGRAILYGLQTLLVAMKIEQENTGQGFPITIPQLNASSPDETLELLRQLQRLTLEEDTPDGKP